MSKDALLAHFNHLLAAASVADFSNVATDVRRDLAVFCIQEARKGDFRPTSGAPPAEVRKEFLAHFKKHFIDWDDIQTVFDYTKELLSGARTLAPGATHPISAVVLYATWMEHWLNAILLTRAQKRGRTSEEADTMIRSARFHDKIGWLWQLLELPPVDAEHLEKLKALNGTRNYYLHYRYEGGDPDKLLVGISKLAAAIADIEATVTYSQTFELDVILKDEVAAASTAFEFDARGHLAHLYD